MFSILVLTMFSLVCQAQTGSASSSGTQSRAAETAEAVRLTADASIDRQLKGGATDAFLVKLSAGDFIYVVVEQKGIDVAVSLFGPDRKQITRMDSPNANQGAEPIVAVAQDSGDHRIEVRSGNSKAPAAGFEIRIVALRRAVPGDAEQVAAERSFAEGQRLRTLRTAESRRAAVQSFEQALRYFQSGGPRERQALTLLALGVVHAESSEFRKALTFLDQTLSIVRALGNQNLEGSTLNLIGGAYDVLGDVHKALDFYGQALALFRKTASPSESAVLNNIAKVYNDVADLQTALEYYSQALALARTLGDQRREAIVLHNLGTLAISTGEPEKALALFQQALIFRKALGDKGGEAEELNSIGTSYRLLGELAKSLDYYNQALPLRRAVGDRRLEAVTLDNIGATYAALGQPEKALEQHNEALKLYRSVDNPRGEAISLGNIAYVHFLRGAAQQSIETYEEALSAFSKLNDPDSGATILQGIARAERSRGNLAAAHKRLEDALQMFEKVRATVGDQESRGAYFASRQDAYKLYVDVLMQEHARDPARGFDAEALQVSERARARGLLELLNEAHVDIRQRVGIELIERERKLNQLLNAKAQRQLPLMGRKNSQEQLVQLNQEISELETEYQQVRVAIRKESPEYAAMTQPQPLSLKEIQQLLDPNTVLLEYSLGDERSYLWTITQTSLKTFELPKLGEIKKASQQVYESLTARSVMKSLESPVQRHERIAQADEQFQQSVAQLSRMVLAPAAGELGTKRVVVVADGALQYVPFAALSVSSQSTVIRRGPTNNGQRTAGDGPATSYRPLIVDHEVVSLPSASALAVQRRTLADRKPAPRAVAVIADPVFSTSDTRFRTGVRTTQTRDTSERTSATDNTRLIEHLADKSTGQLSIRRLPFTRKEGEQILAVAPRAENMMALDFRANRSTATGGELSKYRYVHFATHGYLDSEQPGLSAIVLSLIDEDGKPQDGFLRAREIYNLKLPAELVVLSACETGLGKEVKGEGLVGLTRGFMYAGARRVVVSLWNVNDKATAELMARFYRGMLQDNKTPAAALRAAQVALLADKQRPSPYYWAAFVMQGEWR